jgi:hypothetical protein
VREDQQELGADDIELVLENASVRRPSRRVERSQWSSAVYKDSDEDCADSGDEGFVVSDSDEETGRKATRLLRDYTLSEGSDVLYRICACPSEASYCFDRFCAFQIYCKFLQRHSICFPILFASRVNAECEC